MERQRLTKEQLLAIPDWRERLRLLTIQALHESLMMKQGTDTKPKTIPEAIYQLRQKRGDSARSYSKRVYTSHITISRLESGSSKGTPTLLERIAADAQTLGMANTSEYLRLQATLLSLEINKRGGKR